MATETILIFVGGLAGGFVNGLTGFGAALAAMPLWLGAVSPATAAQLAAASGVIGHVRTLPSLRASIEPGRVVPFLVAGVIGVPFGLALVPQISVVHFKLGVGLVLVIYCGFMLITRGRHVIAWESRSANGAIGFIGGFMAGLAGLSGPAPVIWASMQVWSRHEKRALIQSFNLTILSAMLAGSAAAGLMTAEFFRSLLIALPGTIIGAQLGNALYRRLDDRRYDGIVLGLLMLSGVALIASAL